MQATEILQRLITYPTITPKECGIYAQITQILGDFEVIALDKNQIKNLFCYRVFGSQNSPKQEDSLALSASKNLGQNLKNSKNPTESAANAQKQNGDTTLKNPAINNLRDFSALAKLPHLCFAGHVDVVPPGEGWGSDPFVPLQKEGKIYGRGAQDMKGGIAGFLAAILQAKKALMSSKSPKILSVLLTSDEEGVGIDGTRYVLEFLAQKGFLPTFAIVAEPTCNLKMGDVIKIGRRGSINGELLIKGKQGHVAYPEKCKNPTEILGARLGRLAGVDLDSGDESFAPSKLVITDIRGGIEAVNVTPNSLKILFNVRNNTKTTKQDIQKYISSVLEGVEHELTLKQSSHPFLSPKEGYIAQKMQDCIQEILKISPELSTSGGTSDARFFAKYGIEVVEFGVKNDRIHGIDECVEIADLEALCAIFARLVTKFAQDKILEKNLILQKE